jgi:hypothetical protein
MHWAALDGRVDVIKALKEAGADVARNTEVGQSKTKRGRAIFGGVKNVFK